MIMYCILSTSSLHLRIQRLKVSYPAVDILAGPAASVREAKRLIQAGADGIVAGTGCDVGGDPQAPVATALGRGEATMVYEVGVVGCRWGLWFLRKFVKFSDCKQQPCRMSVMTAIQTWPVAEFATIIYQTIYQFSI